ncbi:MAG: hypothetical protein KDE27_01435 [Planctomycetes bacterium]|nr:hypothetical protein [Planctomycetota bacterium]
MNPSTVRSGAGVPFVLTIAAALPAQGKFVNFEDPQVKPIAVASVGTNDYVLACNTPDNSVEVYLAEWDLDDPIARVPVGLSPVSVKWDPTTGCFYSCNYLGDSISRVRLDLVPASGGIPETVHPVLERTAYVGDEPTDIAFDAGGGTAVVTLHSKGLAKRINLADLSQYTPAMPLFTLAPTLPSPEIDDYVDPASSSQILWLVKQARRVALLPDGRSYFLNTMGGEISDRSVYDLGVFMIDDSAGGTTFHALSGTGSTNFGFAINGDNDRMYVVSQIANNVDNFGVGQVEDDPTGFVQTWLQVVDLPSGGAIGQNVPVLQMEQEAGVGAAVPGQLSIDLNRDYSDDMARSALPIGETLAQVTDVILIPDPTPNAPERIVLAAFGSDRVAILTEDLSQDGGYARTLVDIPIVAPAGAYSAAGPRGLAWSANASEPGSGTTGLVYVLNRLDNSIAVVNPANGNVTGRRLAFDPTPDNIRNGRKFLYTAKLTSGNGTVSCSSCHVDARTDGMRWRLGETAHSGGTIPTFLIDGYNENLLPLPQDEFPRNKPEIVTQTLQGLVNYHLEPDGMQFMATNAPYHWRGDKPGFTDFNEAFVNLQGMTSVSAASSGPDARGFSAGEMQQYASFINTIHHPPNPDQPNTRTYGGSEGDPTNPTDAGLLGGALWGRKIFHIAPSIEGRSCVNCHSLPDGSSNTLTIVVEVPAGLASVQNPAPVLQWHPMETAALRNIGAREALLPDGFVASGNVVWPINGTAGLHHGGVGSLNPTLGGLISTTLNDNVHRTFVPLQFIDSKQAEALTEFIRQLDTGTAPLIGFAWTMTAGGSPTDARFDLAIGQAEEANVGVAAYRRVGGVEQGFWYDVTLGEFREESGSASLTQAQLVNALSGADDVLIVQATPAGSERRVASLDGVAPALLTSGPMNIELEPMVPDTAYEGITHFDGNIDPNHPTRPFVWNPNLGSGPVPLPAPPTPQSQQAQRELATAAAKADVGVPDTLRHEPPRRFRVAGDNIANGAKLGIESWAAPNVLVWFDLTPTPLLNENNRQIWETTEELDALQTMALLCGGYSAPSVLAVLLGDFSPATINALDAKTWNSYRFYVKNEDGSVDQSGWEPLEIADDR